MKFSEIYISTVDKTDPFHIYFVYPKVGDPLVIKGRNTQEAKNIIKRYYPEALVRYTFWQCDQHRGGWYFTCDNIRYCYRRVGNRYKHTVLVNIKDKNKMKVFHFRNMPKKWIPEFNITPDPAST